MREKGGDDMAEGRLCDCCRIYSITEKDVRTYEGLPIQYRVCPYCKRLHDVDFNRVLLANKPRKRNRLDPKEVLGV